MASVLSGKGKGRAHMGRGLRVLSL